MIKRKCEWIDAYDEWTSDQEAEESDFQAREGIRRWQAQVAALGEGDAAPGRDVRVSRSPRKKREFRKLFIIRLSAAAEMRGMRYSRLIHGLKLLNIGLDRKSLSELAIHDPQTFDAIFTLVRAEIDKHDAAVKQRQQAKRA